MERMIALEWQDSAAGFRRMDITPDLFLWVRKRYRTDGEGYAGGIGDWHANSIELVPVVVGNTVEDVQDQTIEALHLLGTLVRG